MPDQSWIARFWPHVAVCLLVGIAVHGLAAGLDLARSLDAWLGTVEGLALAQLPFSVTAVALTATTLALARQRHYAALLATRIRSEQAAKERARLDPLTNLPNRSQLSERLTAGLDRSRAAAGPSLALVMLDLDQFRNVNDSLGHAQGDHILVEAAERLRGIVRGGDTIARVGGDEFAVILPAIRSRADAENVAARLVAQLCRPHGPHQEIRVGASAGVAVSPEDGNTPEQLLEHAELALYQAKEAGQGGCRFYDAQLKERLEHRIRVEQELRLALERNELELFFQPLIDLVTGRPSAAEALIRWRHPERGLLGPGEFLPVAEASDLMAPLSAWVLETACAQAAAWRAAGAPRIRVAVNLSAAQFGVDLVADIERVLEESRLDPTDLELEITENIIIERASVEVLDALTRLREAGVGLAFDDFGTGYSSLLHLKQVPVDRVKIDRSFVGTMLDDADDAAIVRAVIHLAKSLGLKVVAEGIEQAGQVEALLAEGCDEGQGYLFSPPRPADEVLAFLLAPPTIPALKLAS